MTLSQSSTVSRYSVLLAINEPDVAVTVRYDDVQAASEDEAAITARRMARREFGHYGWEVERIEVER
jgi:hypothetical protein